MTTDTRYLISVASDHTVCVWSITDQMQLALAVLDTMPTHLCLFEAPNRIVLGDKTGNLYSLAFTDQERFENTLSMTKLSADLFTEEGWRLTSFDDFEEAAESYSNAMAFEPDNPRHYSRRAATLIHQGDFHNALIDINHGIELIFKHSTPNNYWAKSTLKTLYRNRSTALFVLGQVDKSTSL